MRMPPLLPFPHLDFILQRLGLILRERFHIVFPHLERLDSHFLNRPTAFSGVTLQPRA